MRLQVSKTKKMASPNDKANSVVSAPKPGVLTNPQRPNRSVWGLWLLLTVLTACHHTDEVNPGTQLATPPAGFTSKQISVNGISLHLVMGGQGDPLVLLHGWPATWYEWNRIMPQLAQKYTVIVPDLRGAGESSRPQPATGYDKRTMAEDIYQLVKQLGYQRIKLVGHDVGLNVAYAYAVAHPADVQKLVLLDTPVLGVEPVWSQVKGSESLWHWGFQMVRGLPEDLVAGKEREYLLNFYSAFSATGKNPLSDEEFNEFVRAYSQPGAMSAGFEYFRAFPTDEKANAESAKTKLQMPVLGLGGEQGFGPLMLAVGQSVATNVTGGSIPNCGHWIVEEQPDYLLNQLLTFFAK